MIATVSADFSASIPSDSQAAAARSHWLEGIYFVPSPDISDETRWAINQGRAMPLWEGLMAILHGLERKGSTDTIKAASRRGMIEHMGVNGIAKAIHMSPTAVLRQLRHLEKVVGIVATDQRDFTLETDPVTGKIVRNYAKAEPKSVTITIKPHHLRPARAAQAVRAGTPGSSPKATGDTHEPTARTVIPQGRNERVSKERISKEIRSFGTNRRPTSAGPLGRPAASAAKADNPSRQAAPPPLSRNEQLLDELRREEARKKVPMRVRKYADGLGWSENEVKALWKTAWQELKRLVEERGIDKPEYNRLRRFLQAPERATISLPPELEKARQEALAEFQREDDAKAEKDRQANESWKRFMSELSERKQQAAPTPPTAFDCRQAVTEAVSASDEPQEEFDQESARAAALEALRHSA
jgi:hypothetical protein